MEEFRINDPDTKIVTALPLFGFQLQGLYNGPMCRYLTDLMLGIYGDFISLSTTPNR